MKAELTGLMGDKIFFDGDRVKDQSVAWTDPAVARKTYKLLKEIGVTASIEISARGAERGRRVYRVDWHDDDVTATLTGGHTPQRCCDRSFLRGAFIGYGSMTSPKKQYHFEIAVKSWSFAERLSQAFGRLKLSVRLNERRRVYVVYLKHSEEIVDVLNVIGAHNALLKLENLRIMKDMRNRVNRLVNSETSNVRKTVDAAVSQIEAIKLISAVEGMEQLPIPLRVLARLRMEYPYASLRELGEMIEPKLSKSGVSYRMRKIMAYAEELSGKPT